MRYLCEHPLTQELLDKWRWPFHFHFAAFFFWNIGTHEQKSQLGLLRALLYNILSKNRYLIPVVLHDQWNHELRDLRNSHFLGADIEWDLQTLRTAFEVLRSQEYLRVCLFIDGLDEYENGTEGSYSDMISFFEWLTATGTFKVCLSSRPWLVFEDSFRSCPTLQLQHLTRTDIVLYINDKLSGHKRMMELRSRNPEESNALIQEIVSKASGVFLWVTLVVKSLLDGSTNRDRISDLRKRLLLLPPDLETLYRHMFMNHIDSLYHEQSSRIFQIIRAMKDGLGSDSVSLLTLSFTDEQEDGLALKAELHPWSESEISHKCHEMASILNSRCMGLLEASSNYPDQQTNRESTVDYIHRSAYESFALPDIWKTILSRTKKSFDPYLRLLEAHVLIIKVATTFSLEDGLQDVEDHIYDAFLSARGARKSSNGVDILLLDELDRTVASYWLRGPQPRDGSDSCPGTREECHHWAERWYCCETRDLADFSSLAISYGLTNYMQAKLLHDKNLVTKKNGKPLLEYIYTHGTPDIELVSLLLDYGADPNQLYLGRNFWQYILGEIAARGDFPASPFSVQVETSNCTETIREVRLESAQEQWFAILDLFIKAGADPNALCYCVQSSGPTTSEYSNLHSVGENSENPVMQLITPLSCFSPEGLLPNIELENALKSRGAIPFMEQRILNAIDEEGRRVEALRLREETVPQVQKLVEKPKSKRFWHGKLSTSEVKTMWGTFGHERRPPSTILCLRK